MKLGLSLSGGGIKGIAHVGAIKALEESGIKFDYISGTSSGSIIATLYACGYKTEEIYNIFKKYAKSVKYFDYRNILKLLKNIFSGKGFLVDGLNSGITIKNLINKMCEKKNIENINQIKMPLLIPAVNIYNEKLYVFSNNILQNKSEDIKYIRDINIGTAVQASCSYPGIFSPCEYNDTYLVDGGIAENLPWRETKRAGADKVLSIVFSNKNPIECCKNISEIVSKSFSILCHELYKYEWDGTDYLLNIKTEKVGLLETKKMDYLYKEGYNQTIKKIPDIKNKLNI